MSRRKAIKSRDQMNEDDEDENEDDDKKGGPLNAENVQRHDLQRLNDSNQRNVSNNSGNSNQMATALSAMGAIRELAENFSNSNRNDCDEMTQWQGRATAQFGKWVTKAVKTNQILEETVLGLKKMMEYTKNKQFPFNVEVSKICANLQRNMAQAQNAIQQIANAMVHCFNEQESMNSRTREKCVNSTNDLYQKTSIALAEMKKKEQEHEEQTGGKFAHVYGRLNDLNDGLQQLTNGGGVQQQEAPTQELNQLNAHCKDLYDLSKKNANNIDRMREEMILHEEQWKERMAQKERHFEERIAEALKEKNRIVKHLERLERIMAKMNAISDDDDDNSENDLIENSNKKKPKSLNPEKEEMDTNLNEDEEEKDPPLNAEEKKRMDKAIRMSKATQFIEEQYENQVFENENSNSNFDFTQKRTIKKKTKKNSNTKRKKTKSYFNFDDTDSNEENYDELKKQEDKDFAKAIELSKKLVVGHLPYRNKSSKKLVLGHLPYRNTNHKETTRDEAEDNSGQVWSLQKFIGSDDEDGDKEMYRGKAPSKRKKGGDGGGDSDDSEGEAKDDGFGQGGNGRGGGQRGHGGHEWNDSDDDGNAMLLGGHRKRNKVKWKRKALEFSDEFSGGPNQSPIRWAFDFGEYTEITGMTDKEIMMELLYGKALKGRAKQRFKANKSAFNSMDDFWKWFHQEFVNCSTIIRQRKRFTEFKMGERERPLNYMRRFLKTFTFLCCAMKWVNKYEHHRNLFRSFSIVELFEILRNGLRKDVWLQLDMNRSKTFKGLRRELKNVDRKYTEAPIERDNNGNFNRFNNRWKDKKNWNRNNNNNNKNNNNNNNNNNSPNRNRPGGGRGRGSNRDRGRGGNRDRGRGRGGNQNRDRDQRGRYRPRGGNQNNNPNNRRNAFITRTANNEQIRNGRKAALNDFMRVQLEVQSEGQWNCIADGASMINLIGPEMVAKNEVTFSRRGKRIYGISGGEQQLNYFVQKKFRGTKSDAWETLTLWLSKSLKGDALIGYYDLRRLGFGLQYTGKQDFDEFGNKKEKKAKCFKTETWLTAPLEDNGDSFHHKPKEIPNALPETDRNLEFMETYVYEFDDEREEDITEEDIIPRLGKNLTKDEKRRVTKLLLKYKKVFARNRVDVGCLKEHEFKINLKPGAKPVVMKPFRVPQKYLADFEKQIKELLQKGLIAPSDGEYSASTFMRPKSDGGGRLCTAFVGLNDDTKKDPYYMPQIKDLIWKTTGHKYFTKLDIRAAYHHIPIKKEHQKFTGFNTPFGNFIWLVLTYGLTGAPGHFGRVINWIFRVVPNLAKFYDDLLQYAKTFEEAFHAVSLILAICAKKGIKLKLSKCSFMDSDTIYCGHELDGITNLPKIQKLTETIALTSPKSLKEFRSKISAVSYFAPHMLNYQELKTYWKKYMKADAVWNWIPMDERKWNLTIDGLRNIGAMKLPEMKEPFVLFTDASDAGIGCCLMQCIPGQDLKKCLDAEGNIDFKKAKLMPVEFASKTWQTAEQKWSSNDKELRAMIYGIEKYRWVLLTQKFWLITDHRNLKFMRSLTQNAQASQKRARHLNRLAEFDFVIQPIPGAQNVLADYCSRYCGEVKNRVFLTKEKAKKTRRKNKWQLARDKREAKAQKAADKKEAAVSRYVPFKRKVNANAKPFVPAKAPLNIIEEDKSMTPSPQRKDAEKAVEEDVEEHKYPPGFFKEKERFPDETEEKEEEKSDYEKPAHVTPKSAVWQRKQPQELPLTTQDWYLGEEFDENLRGLNEDGVVALSIDWQRTDDRFSKSELLEGQKNGNISAILWKSLNSRSNTERQSLSRELPKNLRKMIQKGFFVLKDGLVATRKGQFVVPKSLRAHVIHHAHEGSAHIGRNRTFERVERKYWWSGMRQDIISWIKTCEACQFGKDKTSNVKHKMKLWPAKEFNEVLHIDVWGPYPRSRRGNKYIIGLKDRFTRYIVLEPVPNQKARTIAKVIKKCWISIWGAPKKLMSDCGSNLVGSVVRQLCEMYGIKPQTTTPYYPEGNGSMERVFRFMGACMRVMNIANYGENAKHSKTWDLDAYDIMEAHNQTKSRAVDMQPIVLVSPNMEFQMRIWDEMTKETEFMTERERTALYSKEIRKFSATKRKLAQQRQRWYDAQRKEYFDKGKTGKDISIGSEVLRFEGMRRLKQNKLQPYFSGPWLVTGKHGPLCYLERMKGKRKIYDKINMKWLKRFNRRE